MDQMKIGSFLKELRMEKGLTQAKLAEQLNTSNRSVSRWENGSTLPDLSIIVELADFYGVDVREIIDGERKSENMQDDLKDTLMTVADYSKKTTDKKVTGVAVKLSVIFGSLLVIVIALFAPIALGGKSYENTDDYPIYRQVYIDESMTNGLLTEYLIQKMPEGLSENSKNFANPLILSTEEKSEGIYYVYAWVCEAAYSYDAQVLTQEYGAFYPCRFELKQENNEFTVVNAEMPRDGSYYADDVKSLFPQYVRGVIFGDDRSDELDALSERNLKEAKAYFGME